MSRMIPLHLPRRFGEKNRRRMQKKFQITLTTDKETLMCTRRTRHRLIHTLELRRIMRLWTIHPWPQTKSFLAPKVTGIDLSHSKPVWLVMIRPRRLRTRNGILLKVPLHYNGRNRRVSSRLPQWQSYSERNDDFARIAGSLDALQNSQTFRLRRNFVFLNRKPIGTWLLLIYVTKLGVQLFLSIPL